MNEEQIQKIDGMEFAIVEVMGHNTYAGKVSTVNFGAASLIRVDVPATKHGPAFTKLIGVGSIYAMTPCSEAVATAVANRLGSTPVTIVDLPSTATMDRLLEGGEIDDHEPL